MPNLYPDLLPAHLSLWNDFCREQNVLRDSVPLFASASDPLRDVGDSADASVDASMVRERRSLAYWAEDLRVQTFRPGRTGRPLLRRSDPMDALVIQEVEKVIADYRSQADEYEGLIYMMFWTGGGVDPDADIDVVPLYIGKSEKYGRGEKNLSANIAGIRTNYGKFCRWGYNYAYHLGDLSAVVCPGHDPGKATLKYRRWAERLFVESPEAASTATPRLRQETRFWIRAWRRGGIGIWREYGATSLTFLEYLLIGVASDLFPRILLNTDGVNR